MIFDDFAKLVKPLIEAGDQLDEMQDIIVNEEYTSTNERDKDFRDRTGDSRRNFFRVRDELVEKSEKVKESAKGGTTFFYVPLFFNRCNFLLFHFCPSDE